MPFAFLINIILSEYDTTRVEATGVIYWFTLSLPLSYLAPISSKRQSSRELGVMLALSTLPSHLLLFVLLPFLPSSLQRSRLKDWMRLCFHCFMMLVQLEPDNKCVFPEMGAGFVANFLI